MFENIKTWWADASIRTRLGFVTALALIALVACGFTYWTFKSDYQVLFADMAPQDAATIIAELDKMKIAYKIDDSGSSVLVDRSIVYKTRLKLMGKELPLHGAVGFEIFNNTDFGMTEFAQKVNYQRALQGELSRTIMALEEVKSVRVHLVMPESGLFKKNRSKPKASITLTMKPNEQLRSEQVSGIQRLVAASVPEIEGSSVTILDQHGVALTRAGAGEGDTDVANARLEMKKQTETYFTKKVAEVLDKAFGPGQAIVSVDVTLNQNHTKVTREDVIPANSDDGDAVGVVVRRRESSRDVSRMQDGGGQPEAKIGSVGEGTSTSEVDYQNGRKVEQIVSTPGSIVRISVGVLLPHAMSEDRLNGIREVIKMAAGLNAGRGDAIAVYSVEQLASGGVAPATIPILQHLPSDPHESSVVTKTKMANPHNDKFIVIIVSLLVVLGVSIAGMRWFRGSRGRALSSDEREILLRNLQKWMESGVSVQQNGAGK